MTDTDGVQSTPKGFIATIVKLFLETRLAVLLLILSFVLGVAALLLTPEEEEPQIVVPIADVVINAPGIRAGEVEKLVTTPLEQLLWQVDGVEYVYSTSSDDQAVVTVRFYVGQDLERSWVKLYNKINANVDQVPPQVQDWIVKPIEIDDVPIVNVTLHSSVYSDAALRRIADEVKSYLDEIDNISGSKVVGGREEQLWVVVDPARLTAYHLTILDLVQTLHAADIQLTAGTYNQQNSQFTVQTTSHLQSDADVKRLVVGVNNGKPIYVSDVATVLNQPEEPLTYTRLITKPADGKPILIEPSVTIAISKKKGTNAVKVAEAIIRRVDELKSRILPTDVAVTITRNYGDTAFQKVKELVRELFYGIFTIVVILVMAMGLREGIIVAISVPFSFALALFTNYLFGFTINRVTLFALILTLGLVVDDPIINVDNIQRHILRRKYSAFKATLIAVQEVLPPVIVSTLTIIASFIPMFFITGMMGPYMKPMAVNVPLAVFYSMVAALTVVPWAAYHLLKSKIQPEEGTHPSRFQALMRKYRSFLQLFLDYQSFRWGLLATILGLALISGVLVVYRLVPLKMLPFDNKNELQVVVDMPEGTTLEQTDAVVRDLEDYLIQLPETTNVGSFVGTHSPIDFNGLVRHYYFRRKANQADIRINFVDKSDRKAQSHEIALRIRKDIEDIAQRNHARIFIVESPPGPPVVSTLVAEVYGAPGISYDQMIKGGAIVLAQMSHQRGVVDTDISAKDPAEVLVYHLDKEKAALNGISAMDVRTVLRVFLNGDDAATLHLPEERKPHPIKVKTNEPDRTGSRQLARVTVRSQKGDLVSLGEIGTFSKSIQDVPIFHKNLKRVVYVFAEAAGRPPGDIVLDLEDHFADHPLANGLSIEWAGEGEWFITLRVFRDLGLAFGAALIAIYLILIIQTGSFMLPLIQMSAIPLSIIGIMPGFFIWNLLTSNEVGGYHNPVFFTATAMIGMIALGGIVIRNSSVLISFIQDRIAQGSVMKEAILDSGITRMRPIILTGLVTAIGVWPITLDPIFSGLGWSLIFGTIVSTLFSLIVVPTIYWAVYGPREYS